MRLSIICSKSIVAAAASLVALGAQAAGPLDLSTGSTSFGGTPAAGSFSEVWTFTLSVASTVSGSITTAVNGAQDVDFTSIVITGPATAAFTNLLGDPFETWALNGTLMPAGSYTLTLTGINSAAVGSYAGNLGATPVPEPTQYALLLAGLTGLGIWKHRRA